MIVVMGGTGRIGSRVVAGLRDAGIPVRAFVRDPEKAADIVGDGVDLAVGDFADRASIRSALEGAQRVFVSCAAVPRQVEYETTVIDAAADAKVDRIVKLSSTTDVTACPFWDWNGQIEQHLRRASVGWILLRPRFSMLNVLLHAPQIRDADAIFAPAAGARVAMIDPRDIAASAVAALMLDGHESETFELTGPEPLTYEAIAETVSEIVGRPIAFVPVPDEAAEAGLVQAGLADWEARGLVELYRALRHGVQTQTTDTVRKLTGRDPIPFATFARDHAAALGAEVPQAPPKATA